MSFSAGINVLRYSALGVGIFYGFTHQRTITATQRAEVAKREYEHKEQLIKQAKEAYQKTKLSASAGLVRTSALDQNPESANFDLEAYLNTVFEKNP